jgi:hypothetical protein
LRGTGIQTAGLALWWRTTLQVVLTESWNGTSWTSVNSMNTARNDLGGSGTQTAAIVCGG